MRVVQKNKWKREDVWRVSVIIPVFNAEKYFRASLASLVEQSEHPDELIIVDDGSTDDSLKMIKEFVFPSRWFLKRIKGLVRQGMQDLNWQPKTMFFYRLR